MAEQKAMSKELLENNSARADRWAASRSEEVLVTWREVLGCSTAGVRVYLRRLLATGRRGGAAGGGQGGGAGLGGAFLPRRRHLVQAVLSGRVGLHAAGGRRVLEAKQCSSCFLRWFPSAIQCFRALANEW